jgi:protein O-GlcNAc transferase
VEQARCDLLYFWEVGSDALNYLLPFYRLAPLQVTSWGTQVTSGVAEIDYYLASALAEQPEADAFYTESLWRLPGLLTYQRRIAPPPPSTKSYFGIDEAQRMYLFPQTVLKLHPEQDALFGELLRADPHGVLFLKSGKHARSLEVIQARLLRTLPDVYDRIRFVPWQTMVDHHRLVAVADVVLDPLYFGAGSSSYDMWSMNQPLISIPGTFHIGRYSQACYRQMGWMDLVAKSPAEYVALATRVAQDSDYRREACRQLEARTPELFERADSVRELQECLVELIERRRASDQM